MYVDYGYDRWLRGLSDEIDANSNMRAQVQSQDSLYNRVQGTSSVFQPWRGIRLARSQESELYLDEDWITNITAPYDNDTIPDSQADDDGCYLRLDFDISKLDGIWKSDICAAEPVFEDHNIDFENCDELESFLNQFVAKTEQKEV